MYQAELADIYDVLYIAGRAKDYRHEAADLADLVKARNPDAATLLDVACGTGEHLVHLRGLFETVAGLEFSEQMAAIARAKLPGVQIHQGDMRAFALGTSFDAVTCLFSSIGYVQGLLELRAAVRCLTAHLNPGGVLILEPWFTPEQWHDGNIAHTVAEVEGLTIARMGYSTRAGRTSIMRMHYLIGEPGKGIRHFDDEHRMTLFTEEEYRAALTDAGLTGIELLEGWASGRDRFVAVMAGSSFAPAF